MKETTRNRDMKNPRPAGLQEASDSDENRWETLLKKKKKKKKERGGDEEKGRKSRDGWMAAWKLQGRPTHSSTFLHLHLHLNLHISMS